jgi:hypothetical protein
MPGLRALPTPASPRTRGHPTALTGLPHTRPAPQRPADGHQARLAPQHLRILRSARLIRASVRGRKRIYELADDHVAHIARDAVRHATEPQTTIEEKTS